MQNQTKSLVSKHYTPVASQESNGIKCDIYYDSCYYLIELNIGTRREFYIVWCDNKDGVLWSYTNNKPMYLFSRKFVGSDDKNSIEILLIFDTVMIGATKNLLRDMSEYM